MAAGATCKVRLYTKDDAKLKRHPIMRKYGPKYLNGEVGLKLIEMEYTGEFTTTTATEISAPNAVFDGTSSSIPLGIVSSDVKDDAAGVGLRTAKVICLDNDGALTTKTLIMDGTTVVNWDDFPQRIMHMYGASWGSELDAAGTITLCSRGYQQSTQTVVSATAMGLAAQTWDINVNVDGAGATNIDLAVPATTTTWGDLVDIMNAAFVAGSKACVATIIDGKLRVTSNAVGTSTIALTAGTSADIIAALNAIATFTIASAVNGATYLTIGAAKNDSDGFAMFVPDEYMACVDNINIVPTTNAAVLTNLIVQAHYDGFDGMEDPDYGYEVWNSVVNVAGNVNREPVMHFTDRAGKITFKEMRILTAESGWVHIDLVLMDVSKTGRGVGLTGDW